MKVWLIGQDDREEMRAIVEWLATQTSPADLRRNRFLEFDWLAKSISWRPDLIVVLESHPDEYSAVEVMQLFAAAPVSRIVCCAGAWSESAGRTRKVWPLAVRVAAVDALPRLARERDLLTGQQTDFHLPPTASREEWFAAQHPAIVVDHSRLELTVRIESPDAAYRAMLVDVLTQQGMTIAAQAAAVVDIVLWDADPWQPQRRSELRRLVDRGPVIALSGWVTTDLRRELLQAGVLAVVPKSGDLAKLLENLWSAAIAAAEP